MTTIDKLSNERLLAVDVAVAVVVTVAVAVYSCSFKAVYIAAAVRLHLIGFGLKAYIGLTLWFTGFSCLA